ncbi:MAG: PilZ domain-containing protein [Deltaproteobacteria bacterium]|nr:PilZ domain-containing protein [Deltaproteobacteria bacterium]
MVSEERRKYPRVPICDPINYISIDSDGNPLGQNMGMVLNASQIGIKIETYDAPDSDLGIISFVDLNKKVVEIKGRVIYSKQTSSGKFISGIRLQGSSAEKLQFIKKLVRSYHYTKNDTRKFAVCSNRE